MPPNREAPFRSEVLGNKGGKITVSHVTGKGRLPARHLSGKKRLFVVSWKGKSAMKGGRKNGSPRLFGGGGKK